MKTAPVDIRVVDLDANRTEPSRNPEATALRQLHFKLSERPPADWIKAFENVHQNSFHMMKRHTDIRGGFAVVDCVPDEAEKQLEYLKENCGEANRIYNDWVRKVAAQEAAEQSANDAELKKVEELRGKLKF